MIFEYKINANELFDHNYFNTQLIHIDIRSILLEDFLKIIKSIITICLSLKFRYKIKKMNSKITIWHT